LTVSLTESREPPWFWQKLHFRASTKSRCHSDFV